MFEVKFAAGSTVLQQGAMPMASDCMYLLADGSAEVVITGGGGDNPRRRSSEWALPGRAWRSCWRR